MIGRTNAIQTSATQATIEVTAPSGSIVTLTKDSTVYTPTEVPITGSTFSLYTKTVGYGTWTVQATKDSKVASTTVIVDSTQTYDVQLGYVREELEVSSANAYLMYINNTGGTGANYQRYYDKKYDGEAVAVYGKIYGSGVYWCNPVLVSDVSNSTISYWRGYSSYTSTVISFTYNGQTYYLSTSNAGLQFGSDTVITGNYIFDIAEYTGKTYTSDNLDELGRDILDYYNGLI